MHRSYIAPAIIVLAVAALYGWFLYNPVQFDDLYFFMPGTPERFLEYVGLYPRHLAYATLALTSKWFGSGLLGFRIISMALHALVAITLYLFLRQVQKTLSSVAAPITFSALLAALIFAVHPIAVYGAAYLVQRSIVMATLFALVSWLFFLKGLQTKKRGWLWAAVGAYALAVLSKEHAVMVPAVSAALCVWWWRSQTERPTFSQVFRCLLPVFTAQVIIGLLTVLYSRKLLGAVYEIDAPEMLDAISVTNAWPLSVITEGFLFFKYLVLWLLPNPMWMSIDMREPFAASLLAWPQAPGFIAFLLWPVASVYLLWKGGRRGLVGMGLLAPWLLFATELAAVRIQEGFVLYRSYLWLPPAFVLLLLLENKLRTRMLVALTVIVPLFLFPLAWNRLTTFSHPLLLWDDAAELVEGRTGLTGLERIYRNRGIALYNVKKFDLAIEDYSRAISFKPNYSYAYNDRGAALLPLKRYAEAFSDFDTSLKLKPNNVRSLAGRATALELMGRTNEAIEDYRAACDLGWPSACSKLAR